MTTWLKDELTQIAQADDLHIAPFREDGVTYGTPTWFWSFAMDGSLYVRAYNGRKSYWYQAAMRQKTGRIIAAGMTRDVEFEPVDEVLNDRIDNAYRAKYKGSAYLNSMVAHALLRVPLADGTLVATSEQPTDSEVPSLLAASDVLETGWFGADAAAGPGKTVAVVGDGAVGLCAVLAAKQMGAERIIAMSRHSERQKLAREFGATDIVTERGDEGVAKIKEMTGGLGAHSVIEAVGSQESMLQAIRATRPGGHVGFVGVSHGVELPGQELFYAEVHLHGGPAPVRRFLPMLLELIRDGKIDPGRVFDLTLPLDQVAEGYRAMDERRSIKTLLLP